MTSINMRHVTPAFRTFAGSKALSWMPLEMERLGVRRAVIFCGGSMVREGAALALVEAAVGSRLVGRFDGVREHSPVTTVEAGCEFLASVRADAVVAVGGGSAVVTARGSTILLAEDGGVRDLCTQRGSDGKVISPKLLAPKLPQFIVPSTATTAYAKAGTAVRDLATGERLAMFDPKTRAQAVFFDPTVALTAPAPLAWGAALDAFAVSVEALQNLAEDPLAEALLAQATELLATWLPRLLRAPDDPEPRLRLMLGALLCGQGTDYTGGGLVRALAHSVGPRSTVPNGVIGAMLLPLAMRSNASETDVGLRRVAKALMEPGSNLAGGTAQDQAIMAVKTVLGKMQLPIRLRDVGISIDNLPEIIDHTLQDWVLTAARNPAGPDELDEILRTAW